MRKSSFAVFLMLVIAAAGWSQAAQERGWSKYSNTTGKFSVLVPATPEESSATTQHGLQAHIFKVVQRPRAYVVMYADYPAEMLKVPASTWLAQERDGFLHSNPGKLLSERAFKFRKGNSELPALEFDVENVGALFRTRIILDGQRLYMLTAIGSQKVDSTAESRRFLDSLALN